MEVVGSDGDVMEGKEGGTRREGRKEEERKQTEATGRTKRKVGRQRDGGKGKGSIDR